MEIYLNKKQINIPAKKLSPFQQLTGLMFKSKNSPNLLFTFSKPTKQPIHSLFVFFPFLAIWLNQKNQILDHKIIRPFTPFAKPKTKFTKLIELPVNKSNQKILKILVGKQNI